MLTRFARKLPIGKFYSSSFTKYFPYQAFATNQQEPNKSSKVQTTEEGNKNDNDKRIGKESPRQGNEIRDRSRSRQSVKVDINKDKEERYRDYLNDPRIGKILEPRPVQEEISKEVLQENKDELAKRWLSWSKKFYACF